MVEEFEYGVVYRCGGKGRKGETSPPTLLRNMYFVVKGSRGRRGELDVRGGPVVTVEGKKFLHASVWALLNAREERLVKATAKATGYALDPSVLDLDGSISFREALPLVEPPSPEDGV